jgi:hypothetical protein
LDSLRQAFKIFNQISDLDPVDRAAALTRLQLPDELARQVRALLQEYDQLEAGAVPEVFRVRQAVRRVGNPRPPKT